MDSDTNDSDDLKHHQHTEVTPRPFDTYQQSFHPTQPFHRPHIPNSSESIITMETDQQIPRPIMPQPTHPEHISPVKPLTHMPTPERAHPYLPHPGLNTYPEYQPPSNLFQPSRVADPHSQAFTMGPLTSNTFSMSSGSPPYWNEPRGHSYHDPYSSYPGYNKFAGGYDSYGRPGPFFRSTPYQDTLSRSAFEPTRGFYHQPRHHDNFHSSAFSMGTYGSNYMDIPHHPHQNTTQYGRQETTLFPHHQEEFYSGNFQPPFAKPLVSPFR